MAWDSGSITSAAPWAALSQKIKDLCGTAGGGENWEFMGNVPAGTALGQSGSDSYSLDVFRCSGKNTDKQTPVTVDIKASVGSSDNVTGYGFSITPLAAGKIQLLVVGSVHDAAAGEAPSSVVLNGDYAPTFTKIIDVNGGGAPTRVNMSLWIAKTGEDVPTGTTLTVTFANARRGCSIELEEWTGLDTSLDVSGIDPTGATQVVVQAKGASAANTYPTLGTLDSPILSERSVCLQAYGQTASTYTTTSYYSWLQDISGSIDITTPTFKIRSSILFPFELRFGGTTGSTSGLVSSSVFAVELQRAATPDTAFTELSVNGEDWFFVLEIPAADGAVNTNYSVHRIFYGGVNLFSGHINECGNFLPETDFWTMSLRLSNAAGVYRPNRASLQIQPLNVTGFDYWIKMTNSSLVLSTRVAAAEATVGAICLDSFVVGVDDKWPIIIISANYSNANNFMTLPGVVPPAADAEMWRTYNEQWTRAAALGVTSNSVGYVDLWQEGKIHVSRIFCSHNPGRTGGASDSAVLGFARGLWPDDYRSFAAGGTVQLGDTMSIDGNTWTVIGKASAYGYNAPTIVIATRAI